MHSEIDQFDLKILDVLQNEGLIAAAKVAEQVGLSESACLVRIRRLKKQRIVSGAHARLDLSRLGSHVIVLTWVSLEDDRDVRLKKFEREVLKFQEIIECNFVTGPYDYLLRTVTQDFDAYVKIINTLRARDENISNYESCIRTREIRNEKPSVVSLFSKT